MRKSNQAVAKVFLPPSQMEWSDEKLATLNNEQLLNLFQNLKTQREAGRVSESAAQDISSRIVARLPARSLAARQKRPRSQVMLEARAADDLRQLAGTLWLRYDLSAETAQQQSADSKGFKPEALTDKRGEARTGRTVKGGLAAIDRFIAYRVRDSLASLAFVLLKDQPNEAGRYVLLATSDLLEDDTAENEYTPLAREHAWSEEAGLRMRAVPAVNFTEAQQKFETLLAQLAKTQG